MDAPWRRSLTKPPGIPESTQSFFSGLGCIVAGTMNTVALTLCMTLMCLIGYRAEEETNARLLVSKNILNQYLVEGKDLTIEYKIYNVGGTAALAVKLKDDSFPKDDFERVKGFLEVQWDRIAPGTNTTHAVILRPLKSGYFNFTSAEISYLPSEDSSERVIGYTSAPGEGGIVNLGDFDRKFSPHVLDWGVFAVMTLPSLGIPFLLWFRSKSKYDTPKPKKN
ncbi:translocon-associated protein subunit beta-like [Liolophura sinensis]|uniref:translocon-associated protein subunit beta-like n=1 Tax=Liolophura sinensis TaxID=3198878 RepID=UPI003158A7EC